MSDLHDIALLKAVAGGDQKAFADLFALHKDRVYTISVVLTDSSVVAEEIVQDVFLRVWKNRDKLTTIHDFPSWLYTIARNRALTALQKIAREGKNRTEIISWFPGEISDAQKKMDERDMQQLLDAALSRLTKQQRKVFELSRLQGYDREQIAQQLNLSPATVSVHLTIALRSVRAFLSNRLQLVFIPALLLIG